jgi:hypothetical protein
MKWRILTVCLIGFVLAVGVALAQGGKPVVENGEHDFGTKVLAIVTQKHDEQGGGGYVEKAKIRRLGDRYFIVGQVPDMGEEFQASKGTVVWTPVSAVIQITEYDNVETLRKVFAEIDKAKKDK